MGSSPVIILDTHVWVWWVTGNPRLTAAQAAVIAHAYRYRTVGISAVSCWEIAMLVYKGRLQLGADLLTWFREELDYPSVALLPLTPEIAVRAYHLPETFQPDPADRLIVATAIEHGCPLVTSDERIIEHRVVPTIH